MDQDTVNQANSQIVSMFKNLDPRLNDPKLLDMIVGPYLLKPGLSPAQLDLRKTGMQQAVKNILAVKKAKSGDTGNNQDQ